MTAITVSERIIACDRAVAVSGQAYACTVALDAEWDGLDASVRMVYGPDGAYQDFAVNSGACTVTVPLDVSSIELGVYAGRLSTTNRAQVRVTPSILDATAACTPADPSEVWE